MLWFKAFHIIFIVTWFSALFYLPRLFVYHATTLDESGNQRFKVMERRLYYGIMMPSAILATFFGIVLFSYNFNGYLGVIWMQLKLLQVLLLWIYHFICGKYVADFRQDNNQHSARFYRFFNEVPSLFLVGITILVIVKPTF